MFAIFNAVSELMTRCSPSAGRPFPGDSSLHVAQGVEYEDGPITLGVHC